MLGKNDFMTIKELKDENMWPLPWISGKGLIDSLLSLGPNIKGIEIGVCRGENIVFNLELCKNINKIIAIDPYLPFKDWNGFEFSEDVINKFFEIANKNFINYTNIITLIKNKSEIVFKTIEDMEYNYVFIDGEHTYDAVLRDLNNYYSKIVNYGIISGHDYSLPGIADAVNDFRNQMNITKKLHFCSNDVWYWYK